MSLKIIFMGTPEFSIPSLKLLKESNHEVICVYTQSPKKKSRGQKILKTPIHTFSEENNIKVRTNNLNEKNEFLQFKKFNPDLVIVVAYGQMIPDQYLKIPNLLFLNVHASLLPKWRGAAPIERAIINMDKETGVSIMKIEKKLDAGPYISQAKVKINEETTSGSLREELSKIGAKTLLEVIELIMSGKDKYTKQDDSKATHTKKIDKSETKINWNENAKDIVAKINAFSPNPGAWFKMNNQRIKVIKAIEVSLSGKAGTILNKSLVIAAKKNSVKILKLQKEGKKIMNLNDFIVGNSVKIGTELN
tara:strand:+ start:321 stop:1238 length:918 start_codon:yes stop_codon:yes gene_type:complete